MSDKSVTDMSFADYTTRALYEITVERNRERAMGARPAGSFVYTGEGWQPQEYEGFAIISTLDENPGNEKMKVRLVQVQAALEQGLSLPGGYYQLPAESFHQTVANTLSADRFKQHILHAGLEDAYPAMVEGAFDRMGAAGEPPRMKMVGLSIFGTAIGMLGVFEEEEDYNAIINFRSAFYADEQLGRLDVRMTRPFIGHITLTYIEQELSLDQKEQLATVVSQINEGLATEDNYFKISVTGLRRYHHLAEFFRKVDYPLHQF